MTGKKIIIMAVIFALLAGLAVYQNKSMSPEPAAENDQTLLGDMDLNILSGIKVIDGDQTVTLSKKNGTWQVEDLHGYPADFKKLAENMRKTADLKLGIPVRTGNLPESEFGFDENTKKIELLAGKDPVATIEIGARREASEEAGWSNLHFVRKTGDDNIYLVDSDFRAFSEKPIDWIIRQIVDVNGDDIRSVKTGEVELKEVGTDWTLVGIDDTTEDLDTAEAGKMRAALRYLNCKSIADPAKSDEELGFAANPSTYIAKTADGFEYKVLLGAQMDGGQAARLSVKYNAPVEPAAPADDASQEEKDAYAEKLAQYNQTCNDNLKKAEELNDKLSQWTYILDNSDATDFQISRLKLIGMEKPEEDKNT